MDETIRVHVQNLHSDDRELQNQAFMYLLAATEHPVPWAYEVWDELVATLHHKNNRQRAIAAQILCNLAKSDPEQRMLDDFEVLLAVTKDERFVTARHCLQALWKVGAAGKPQQALLMQGLARRFDECAAEKNGTLIRYDILQGLRNLYAQVPDEKIKAQALDWIARESDPKYRKKYASVWRGV